jgi:hypothetical protein
MIAARIELGQSGETDLPLPAVAYLLEEKIIIRVEKNGKIWAHYVDADQKFMHHYPVNIPDEICADARMCAMNGRRMEERRSLIKKV